MVACPRISSTASSITRLVELADQNCAIKSSSSVTWRASTSLHSHGKHLLPQQMACLSEFWLFIVSHKLRRKNGEAPSSPSTMTGWAMMTCSVSTCSTVIITCLKLNVSLAFGFHKTPWLVFDSELHCAQSTMHLSNIMRISFPTCELSHWLKIHFLYK